MLRMRGYLEVNTLSLTRVIVRSYSYLSIGETMTNTKPKVKVFVAGVSVDFSIHYLKNGGASIGLKQKALDTKASTKAKPSTTKKSPKAKSSTKLVDGVRFEGTDAIIRIGGVDVDTIARPKVAKAQKPRKQWKKAINSNLWNVQGGNKDATVWAYKVGYGDMPSK